MFVQTKTAPPLTHWLVDLMLAILAFAIAVAITSSAWGQETANRIPSVPPENGYSSMAWAEDANHSEDYRTTLALVQIIDMHRAGYHQEVEALWEQATLPKETAVWKELSLAVADLAERNYKEANSHLTEAARLDANNPLPHYYKAMVALATAERVDDRYDDAGPDVSGYVDAKATPSPDDPIALRDEAIGSLLRALDCSPVRDVNRSLLNVAWVLPDAHSLEMPLTVPTIDELMSAMGAGHWEADAHWRLGALLMAKNSLAEAEDHWDRAAEMGMNLRLEYRALSERHRASGESLDAVRCKLKSMRFGGPYLGDA